MVSWPIEISSKWLRWSLAASDTIYLFGINMSDSDVRQEIFSTKMMVSLISKGKLVTSGTWIQAGMGGSWGKPVGVGVGVGRGL